MSLPLGHGDAAARQRLGDLAACIESLHSHGESKSDTLLSALPPVAFNWRDVLVHNVVLGTDDTQAAVTRLITELSRRVGAEARGSPSAGEREHAPSQGSGSTMHALLQACLALIRSFLPTGPTSPRVCPGVRLEDSAQREVSGDESDEGTAPDGMGSLPSLTHRTATLRTLYRIAEVCAPADASNAYQSHCAALSKLAKWLRAAAASDVEPDAAFARLVSGSVGLLVEPDACAEMSGSGSDTDAANLATSEVPPGRPVFGARSHRAAGDEAGGRDSTSSSPYAGANERVGAGVPAFAGRGMPVICSGAGCSVSYCGHIVASGSLNISSSRTYGASAGRSDQVELVFSELQARSWIVLDLLRPRALCAVQLGARFQAASEGMAPVLVQGLENADVEAEFVWGGATSHQLALSHAVGGGPVAPSVTTLPQRGACKYRYVRVAVGRSVSKQPVAVRLGLFEELGLGKSSEAMVVDADASPRSEAPGTLETLVPTGQQWRRARSDCLTALAACTADCPGAWTGVEHWETLVSVAQRTGERGGDVLLVHEFAHRVLALQSASRARASAKASAVKRLQAQLTTGDTPARVQVVATLHDLLKVGTRNRARKYSTWQPPPLPASHQCFRVPVCRVAT